MKFLRQYHRIYLSKIVSQDTIPIYQIQTHAKLYFPY